MLVYFWWFLYKWSFIFLINLINNMWDDLLFNQNIDIGLTYVYQNADA